MRWKLEVEMKIKILFISLVSLTLIYSNCGNWKSFKDQISSSSSSSSEAFPFGNQDIIPLSSALTAAIPNFTQIESSLRNLTCVTNPSRNIIDNNNLMRNVYSQTGQANSMSQSVQAVNLRISSFFCDEAYTREMNLAANQRCVYSNVDFTRGPEQFDAARIQQMATAMATRFWGTSNISAPEIAAFSQGILDIINASTQTGTQATRTVATSSCTLALNVLNGLLM